jgi:hypothetical protein
MTARKLSGFLSEPTSGLSRLTAEAKRLLALSHVWEAIAPNNLARFSRVGPVKDRILTLYADNGAVAAKLKQQLPRFLLNFRQRGHDLTAIQVQVQVNGKLQKPGEHLPKPAIPAAGIASLEQLEHDLEPSPLKQALTHLLEHQRRPEDELEQEDAADGDQPQDDQK